MKHMPGGLEKVSILITTLNEEINLPHCLQSIRGAGEVFLVDSHSTDRTCEIAESFGAKVFKHQFEDYARQKNWAFDNLPWSNDWIFIIDADEQMTPELAKEIGDIVSGKPKEVCFAVRWKFMWMGKWLRYSGFNSIWDERLLLRGKARYDSRGVNEHMVAFGEKGRLRNRLIHEDRKGLTAWLEKHNRYSTMEALEALKKDVSGELTPKLFSRDPIARRRWLQRYVWPYVPFKPTARFLYQYVFKLGFLDGVAGYHYARLKSQYTYWTELKKRELLRERTGG